MLFMFTFGHNAELAMRAWASACSMRVTAAAISRFWARACSTIWVSSADRNSAAQSLPEGMGGADFGLAARNAAGVSTVASGTSQSSMQPPTHAATKREDGRESNKA
jgi:hypothetical protein